MDNIFKKLTRGKALFFTLIVGMGGSFQTGYQLTGMSSPSPFIQSFINSTWCERYEETPTQQTVTLIWSVIIALYPVGGLTGAASVKYVTGRFGRKKVLIGNSLFTLVGGVIMLASKYAASFEMIMAARFLCGIAGGLGGGIQLMYLRECSPKELRGTMALSAVFFLTLGKLAGQVFGLSELLGREHLWNVLLSAPACLIVLHVLVLPLFPEAPRYLLMNKGDVGACRKALQTLWGPGDYQVEIDEMLAERAASEGAQIKGLLEFLRDRSVKHQIIAIAMVSGCIQLSGVPAVSIFAFDVLRKADVPVDQIRYVTLGFGGSEVLATITATVVVECCGRKPLLLGGFSTMFTMLLLITVTLNLKNPAPWVAYCTAAFFVIFIMCVNGGPGGASMALMSDSFLQTHYPAAMTLNGFQRWSQLAVLGFAFPFIINGLGTFCFLLFSSFCLLGALYCFFLVPETKGKTQLEVCQQFNTITVFGRNKFMETNF